MRWVQTLASSLKDGEFIIEAGSLARNSWVGPPSHNYANLHAELVRSRVLVPDGEHCRFTEDYAFRSPSAAAAAVNGRPSNGQVEWKTDPGGHTYRDWEVSMLESMPASSL
jgi:hypothetical protein